MASLQVKNLSPELHELLRARAQKEGRTISQVVTEILEREAHKARVNEWLERNRREAPRINFDTEALMDAVREEYDPR